MANKVAINKFVAHIRKSSKKNIKLEDWQKPYAEAYLRNRQSKS